MHERLHGMMIRAMDQQAQPPDLHPQSVKEVIAGIGSRIVQLRTRRGWSQKELARRTKMRSARLSMLERSLRVPMLEELLRLAPTLGIDLDGLVFGQTPAQARTLQLLRELQAVATPEDLAGLSQLFQVLLLGFRESLAGRGSR
jgi:transcriptional regulator with XRE-family HTH domain